MERRRLAFWLALSGVSLVVVVGAGYLYLVGTSSLPFAAMDFDGNGFVTFHELAYANAFDARPITENGQACTEYYALKDGVRLTIICDDDDGPGAGTASDVPQ